MFKKVLVLLVPVPIDIAQIITPFTQPTQDSGPIAVTASISQNVTIDQNINQIIEQQVSLDTKISETLAVGCYQVQ